MSKFVPLEGFGGGGSSPLNFKVVGGTSEPTNPTENMIWVNTDTPITSWEFSATEPNSFREIELSCVSNNQWYLTCSQSLSVGNVLYFEIPTSVTNTYEAINIIDPVTGNEYFIRNNDGSACTTWVKGTKICVILSDDTNGLNGYGSTGKTAYIINDNSYGVAKGKVWICVGTSSPVEFNALKKNGIQVYPLSAKQYVSGTWVDKTAKSYQGGSWVDWIVYLYNAGNEFTDFTGGWESFSSVYVYDAGIGYGGGPAPTVTRNSTNMKITAKNCSGLVHTRNKIDLTSVKTIKMVGSILPYNQKETTGIYIMTDLIQGYKNKGAARCLPGTVGQTTTGEFTVDVSGLSGKYYVCLAAGSYNNAQNAAEVILEKMWLE